MEQLPELSNVFLQPVIQYGFAGMSVVLLGIIVWLIGKLLAVLKENNTVISHNTEAIRSVEATTENVLNLTEKVHERLLTGK